MIRVQRTINETPFTILCVLYICVNYTNMKINKTQMNVGNNIMRNILSKKQYSVNIV